MKIADLIAAYDGRVPRYTSYPTAPHFSPAVDSSTYGRWLSGLPAGIELSLYLHVPFCARLCLFCGCHTAVVGKVEPLQAYTRDLLAEIDLVAEMIGRRLPVSHIHWGGGTPTILPPDCMAAIDLRLREKFRLKADAEVGVEVDPRTLDTGNLEALGQIGVTRASIGVQDFNPAVQQAIGRIQDYRTTADTVARLRRIGVRSINLDLLYGLPHQTEETVVDTVKLATTLAPDRVAVFGYAHVPWMKRHQVLLPEAALPDGVARYEQSRAAERVLLDAGYEAIGLDHFAKGSDPLAIVARAGRLRRNFQGYTVDDAPVLIGLGASSIGMLPQGYVQNATRVPAWRDAIRGNHLPTARGIALSPEDRTRRAIIERIMCDLSVDLATEPALREEATPRLAQMEADGLVRWCDERLIVTDIGRPFVRTIASVFDSYFGEGAVRHAAAV